MVEFQQADFFFPGQQVKIPQEKNMVGFKASTLVKVKKLTK